MPNFYCIGICIDHFNSTTGQLCPDQSRQVKAALHPPLPPITKEEIMQGKLSSLLIEEDYNLSTMVS